MSIMHPSPVRSTQFDWHPVNRQFYAEISDFGPGFRFDRVYDDACDVGLTVYSRFAGLQPIVLVACERRDREGDVKWWDLVPANGRKLPYSFRVYND